MQHRFTSPTTLALFATLQVCACDEPPASSSRGTPEAAVVTIRLQRVALTTELPGRTSASLVAEVRPQVGGLILSRRFREGTDVKAGELLYQIDPTPYRAEYGRSRAALAMAETRLVLLRAAVERYDELGIQVLTRREIELAAAALRQGEAEVAAARAALHSDRANLDRTRVTAPISGRIGRSTVMPGVLVTAGQASALASVQQLDPIYVDVALPAIELVRLQRALDSRPLQPGGDRAVRVRLKLAEGSMYPLEGELPFSEIKVERSTHMATLQAVFPNPTGKLLPGMLVLTVLNEGTKPDAILVPQVAVTGDGNGKPIAYVVGVEGKLEARSLIIERALGRRWLVSQGLKAGDRVMVEGVNRARPGAPVKAVECNPRSSRRAGEITSAQTCSETTTAL